MVDNICIYISVKTCLWKCGDFVENIVTFKFEYSCEDNLFDVIKEYNSVLRFTYNRLVDNPKYRTAEITQMQKFLNNCDLIGSLLRCSAIFDAKSLISKSDSKVIFGGKKLFVDRCKNKISKEDFRKKKLSPINMYWGSM